MFDPGTVLELLGATAEIMGQETSPTALLIMADDLKSYATKDISNALVRVRQECNRLTLANVIERIEGGWIGPEEAWAAFPKDEGETAIVTDEALSAWHVASRLWAKSDPIGARMAFKETYQRKVAEAQGRRERPVNRVSLGQDPELRTTVVADAVSRNILTQSEAGNLLPSSRDGGVIAGLLTGKTVQVAVDENILEHIGGLRRIISKAGEEKKRSKQKAAMDFQKRKAGAIKALNKMMAEKAKDMTTNGPDALEATG